MGTPYTVQSGDTLSGIAQRHGYSSWEEIYYHDDNAEFRQRRPDPNRIHAGDVLILPGDEEEPEEDEPPDTGEVEPEDEDDEPEEIVPGIAARRTTGGDTGTVLGTQYELREIVVAQGIQFTNADMGPDDQMPQGLQRYFPDMTISGTNAEYVSDRQRVRFTIEVIQTKDVFKNKLQTARKHIVYAGHARYGRGPCFGPTDDPGENWEQGSDPNTTGLWRMAYPVLLIPLEDMEHHGYSFFPVSTRVTVTREMCHPEVNRSRLRAIPIGSIPDEIAARILPSPPEAEFWGYRTSGGHPHKLLLWADWQNTQSTPMDLGATDMQCRCFCHFGCSTFMHNWKILRERKNWQRTETDRFAYFTTGTVDLPIEIDWIRAVFNYPRRNNFDSWYPSLQWARQRVNGRLAARGRSYRVI